MRNKGKGNGVIKAIPSKRQFHGLYLQAKISFCVVITNVTDNATYQSHVGRIFAVFHPFADEVAEDATEVFVTGVT